MNPPQDLAEGRYRIIDRLGEGSMGVVYRAWDEEEGEEVAVKVLSPFVSKSTILRKRFRREADVMARMRHPNIVGVREFREDGMEMFLVMELITGGTLEGWVGRHGAMPPAMAATVLAQASDAIGAAHAEGVVHRDVKPANLLIGEGGLCSVADFGIAMLCDDVRLTRTETRMGSIGYMAPEQALSAKSVDSRADIYSLGATLFALLTAVVPRWMDRAMESHSGELPPVLAHIVLRCTLRSPDHRYPFAFDLSRRLRAALPGLPPVPADTPPLYQRTGLGVSLSSTTPTLWIEDD